MPPRLAHALIDMKSEAGRRTVISGSASVARASLFALDALIADSIPPLQPAYQCGRGLNGETQPDRGDWVKSRT